MDAHANLAYTTVLAAPSPADSGTSLSVAGGTGLYFPAAPFNCTVWPAGVAPTRANAEIVRVTNVTVDTLTITRAQEGTTARTILVGDQIANTATAKTFTDIEGTFAGYQPLSANLTSWSALAPSAKQDASANLASWSAIAPSAKQDASANLTSWSALAPSAKQDAGSYVTVGGALGTPSSGTLTNCTGLPVAGVSGVIGLSIALAQNAYL